MASNRHPPQKQPVGRSPSGAPRQAGAAGRGGRFASALEEFIWKEEGEKRRWLGGLQHVLRLIWAVTRDLTTGHLTLRAMSLVYTTLLSLVPLLAISFSILKGFGVHNQIEPLLQNAFEPLGERRDEVVTGIVTFVDNVQVGVLGTVGFILLFYTTVSLMQKIELAFNDVWQTAGTRTFTERFKDYLTVIVVGPILIFVSVGLAATVMSDPWMQAVSNIRPFGWFIDFLGWVLPMAMVVVAFTFIYVFVPHTRVRVMPALTGGLVAGVLWNALGWLFAGFVAQATRYTAIYSGFATPILFMIWLYVSWLILLIGANIAFYRQNPEYLAGRRLAEDLSATDRDRLVLQALCVIGDCFYSGQAAPDAQRIARRLRVPEQTIAHLLMPLEQNGLLVMTAATPSGYLPARPWEAVTVYDALQALREASNTRSPVRAWYGRKWNASGTAVDAVLREQERLSKQVLGNVSLKELVGETAVEAEAIPPASARALS